MGFMQSTYNKPTDDSSDVNDTLLPYRSWLRAAVREGAPSHLNRVGGFLELARSVEAKLVAAGV